MKNQEPLISILILCYNNQDLLYENLKSVFIQDYSNLEIIIGDDASENFNVEVLINWLSKNRTPNIKRIRIIENEENIGTVANVEKLQDEAKGEYILSIAADDVLYDKNVIKSFCAKAEEIGEEDIYIIAQTELWNNNLTKKIDDFVSQDIIALLKNGTARDVFAECSWHACLPAVAFCNRSIISKIGKLSPTFKLVEDWPMYLRLARMGVKPYFLDIRSSIKHRDGGISHGNTLHSQKKFLIYYNDLLTVYRREVEPFKDLLTEEEKKRAEKYYKDRINAYYSIHLPEYAKHMSVNQNQLAQTDLRKDDINYKVNDQIPKNMVNDAYNQKKKAVLREEVKRLTFRLSEINTIFGTGINCLLCFMIYVLLSGINSMFTSLQLKNFFLCMAIILFLCLIIEIAVNIWLQLRHLKQKLR